MRLVSLFTFWPFIGVIYCHPIYSCLEKNGTFLYFPARGRLFLPTDGPRLATETLLIQRFLSRRGQQLRLNPTDASETFRHHVFTRGSTRHGVFLLFFLGGKGGEKNENFGKYLKVHGIDGIDGMYDVYTYLYIYIFIPGSQKPLEEYSPDFLNINPYQN